MTSAERDRQERREAEHVAEVLRSRNSVPMPAQAPTQALRLSVRTSATRTAGSTSAAQIRSRRRNMTRATAMHATSMMTPEYVM